MKLNIGHTLAAILGIIAGVLEYLNEQTWNLGPHWHPVVTYGVLLITLIGVTPLVGAKIGIELRTLLHIDDHLFVLLCTGLYALAAAVTTFGITGVAKGIILGVIAFASAIGFSPLASAVPAASPRAA